jgi:hypothetical protein
MKVSTQADADADDAATLRDAADVLRRHLPDAVDALAVLDMTADMLDPIDEPEVDPRFITLEAAARALEAHPPMLRQQYVAALRLYAAEPWRIGL